jgi:predicted Zn-ribbon and HTH transcriptional regulator
MWWRSLPGGQVLEEREVSPGRDFPAEHLAGVKARSATRKGARQSLLVRPERANQCDFRGALASVSTSPASRCAISKARAMVVPTFGPDVTGASSSLAQR